MIDNPHYVALRALRDQKREQRRWFERLDRPMTAEELVEAEALNTRLERVEKLYNQWDLKQSGLGHLLPKEDQEPDDEDTALLPIEADLL